MWKNGWIVFLLLLLLLCCMAICICLQPLLRRWFGRRGIGTFANEAEWRDAVGRKAEAMLRHMPAFPEEDTLTFRIAMRRSGVDAQRLVRVRAGLRKTKLRVCFRLGGLMRNPSCCLTADGKSPWITRKMPFLPMRCFRIRA